MSNNTQKIRVIITGATGMVGEGVLLASGRGLAFSISRSAIFWNGVIILVTV